MLLRLSTRLAALAVLVAIANVALAATNCTFTTVGTTMSLTGNCITDTTITVPNGQTLQGNGFTITAIDPPDGHFTGAVVRNGGTTASVQNVTIEASALKNTCDGGDARLRGVMFEGASGMISQVNVRNINQGPSGCQEGNAIEVRNIDAPNSITAIVTHNVVTGYQKTGIVVNGNAKALVEHNKVSASATQMNLAANSIQIGYGAVATVRHNQIQGNTWPTYWVATAVLLYQAGPGTIVQQNNIDGNSDVGIYAYADSVTVDNNRVFDEGPDGADDIGIGNWGSNNVVTNNKVRGFQTPYDGVTGGKNKTIPSPHQ